MAMDDAEYSDIIPPTKDFKGPVRMSKKETSKKVAAALEWTAYTGDSGYVYELIPWSIPNVPQVEIRLTRDRQETAPFSVIVNVDGTSFKSAPVT
jgi:hypothetical protein